MSKLLSYLHISAQIFHTKTAVHESVLWNHLENTALKTFVPSETRTLGWFITNIILVLGFRWPLYKPGHDRSLVLMWGNPSREVSLVALKLVVSEMKSRYKVGQAESRTPFNSGHGLEPERSPNVSCVQRWRIWKLISCGGAMFLHGLICWWVHGCMCPEEVESSRRWVAGVVTRRVYPCSQWFPSVCLLDAMACPILLGQTPLLSSFCLEPANNGVSALQIMSQNKFLPP